MPACKDCKWFDPTASVCKLGPPIEKCHTRACVRACTHQFCDAIKPNQLILEVGYGVSRIARRMVAQAGGIWHGVDTINNQTTRGRYIGSAESIPFADNYFDAALALETIEHWYEFGETPEAGLREIHRVLKPGALLLVTCPIRIHGDRIFLTADLDAIDDLFFKSGLWEGHGEDWRRYSDPFPAWQVWRQMHDELIAATVRPDNQPVVSWTRNYFVRAKK